MDRPQIGIDAVLEVIARVRDWRAVVATLRSGSYPAILNVRSRGDDRCGFTGLKPQRRIFARYLRGKRRPQPAPPCRAKGRGNAKANTIEGTAKRDRPLKRSSARAW